jgi:hypothetical protein
MTDTTAVSGAPDANEIDLFTISVRDMISRCYVETATHITYDLHVHVPRDLDDGETCRVITSDQLGNGDANDAIPTLSHQLHIVRVTIPKPSTSEEQLVVSTSVTLPRPSAA